MEQRDITLEYQNIEKPLSCTVEPALKVLLSCRAGALQMWIEEEKSSPIHGDE